MSDKRIDHVRSLILEIERLKAEYAKVDGIIAAREHELSGLFGAARTTVSPKAASPKAVSPKAVSPKASPHPTPATPAAPELAVARKAPGKLALQPTIKETVLAALRKHPSGVELGALTAAAYGDASEANRRRCEKRLYKLANAKLVTHEGSRWVIIGAAAAPAAPASTPSEKAAPGDSEMHVELLLDAVTAYPGLRNEELRRHVALAPEHVKAALATLREDGLVKTSGIGRWMTYSTTTASSAAEHAAPKVKTARSPSAKPREEARRTHSQVLADDVKILAYVSAHPGLHSADMRKDLGLLKENLASGLYRLQKAGKVKITGKRNLATYTAA